MTTFTFVQVEAAIRLASGPDARSLLLTAKSEAAHGVAEYVGRPSAPS
jgi:hypothetical protein